MHFQSLRDDIIKLETQWQLDTYEKQKLEFQLQEANEEIKLYMSKDPQDKKKSIR